MSRIDRADVVVIGAGLSGLAAARFIVKAGLSVIVLEASDRVGGRVETRRAAGETIEMGAHWTGPGQDAIKGLAAETGVTVVEQNRGGRDLYVDEEPRELRVLDEGAIDPAALAAAVRTIDGLAASVPLEAPWEAPAAKEWDRLTLGSWAEEHVERGARRAIYNATEGWVGVRDEVSFLHALVYSRANGGYSAFLGVDHPPHDTEVFAEGTQTIAIRAAAELGDRVKLERCVTFVRQDADGVTAGGSGFDVRARRLIAALPPPLAGRFLYDPPLPPERINLALRYAPLSGPKFMAVYEEPFWRRAGLSGTIISDRLIVVDASMETGRGILAGLPMPDSSTGLGQGPEARRTRALEWLVRCFGPEAASPIAWEDKDWLTDPYTFGCVLFTTPGTLTTYGKSLRAPVGRIHWAGTETATLMTGHMDGAVRAGERAAAEALAEIGAGG